MNVPHLNELNRWLIHLQDKVRVPVRPADASRVALIRQTIDEAAMALARTDARTTRQLLERASFSLKTLSEEVPLYYYPVDMPTWVHLDGPAAGASCITLGPVRSTSTEKNR